MKDNNDTVDKVIEEWQHEIIAKKGYIMNDEHNSDDKKYPKDIRGNYTVTRLFDKLHVDIPESWIILVQQETSFDDASIINECQKILKNSGFWENKVDFKDSRVIKVTSDNNLVDLLAVYSYRWYDIIVVQDDRIFAGERWPQSVKWGNSVESDSPIYVTMKFDKDLSQPTAWKDSTVYNEVVETSIKFEKSWARDEN